MGAKEWDTNTKLGTTQARDHASIFVAPDWLALNRPSHERRLERDSLQFHDDVAAERQVIEEDGIGYMTHGQRSTQQPTSARD